LIDAMLVNPNLDAICDLAVLIERYPDPSKTERGIIQKNARRMQEIREGEACVLLDVITDMQIPWARVGKFVRGVPHAELGFDFQIDTVPDGWVRDALESADAAIAAGRASSARLEPESAMIHLRDAVAARDQAACDHAILRWRPYAAMPEYAHAHNATLAAARVFRAAYSTPRSADAVGTAWHHAGNAAAHARPDVGVSARIDDRIRCGRRLLLRAMLVAPPGSITPPA